MIALTEAQVRGSFVNASRREVADVTLPADFARLDWTALDYLGWRDPKLARRAYVVVPVDGAPVGVLLVRAETAPRARAQCSWCQDVQRPNDVLFYSARRGGAAGRNGDTVGTLLCEEFECSANVRRPVPPAYLGFDVDAAREARMLELRARSLAFAVDVRSGR